MIRAGLTGGYATGKSFVASEFARLGCEVIQADALGHQVLQPGEEAYDPVIRRFGAEILNANGLIDRKKLASIVFSQPALLTELETIIHPAVFRKEAELTAAFAARQPDVIVIYEAAILIETGHYRHYDRVVLTKATPDVQIQRGAKRDGIPPEQIRARIARQLPDEDKLKYADFVIDTSGAKEDTVRQVNQVFRSLQQLALGVSR